MLNIILKISRDERVSNMFSLLRKERDMGKADVALKEYFRNPERVAAICNYVTKDKGFLPENVCEINGFYSVKSADGKVTHVERDMFCKARYYDREILIGIENQQNINLTFPVRQMEMDYLEHKREIEEIQERNRSEGKFGKKDDFLYAFKEEDTILPILNIVFYWGEGHWDKPHKVSDMYRTDGLPDNTVSLLNDYKVNLIHVREIPDEELEKMESDFKYVVGLLKRTKDKKEYKKYIVENKEYFSRMPRSAVEVIDACVGISRMKVLFQNVESQEEREKVVDMCKALDDLVLDSRNEGRAEGRREGISEGTERVNCLNRYLVEDGRMEELVQAVADSVLQQKLFAEYGI